MRKLVLFDIDGTILSSSGAGVVSMERALCATFGTPGDRAYRYDGKTDKQGVRDQMRRVGFADAEIDARMPEVMRRYLDVLREELGGGAHGVRVYDGVAPLIDVIHARPDVVLGLLTGNIEAGARLKLTSAGVDMGRFVVNAFGSDHEVRAELPAIAQRRMRDAFGVTLEGRDMVVIGDTPADIACGRALGVRAIAVATGRYSARELRSHGPFAVFETLADTRAVLEAIDA